ncbi:MAG: WbuC family cupin fold metalloprotein, partial [Candidatus Competibacter sp.]|nr:WbuC family cupin fold metalloprotein [Candidatus Competibacter sp.]
VFFDDRGAVAERVVLEPGGAVVGINVPAGTFHTVLALTPGTVFFEAKAGPYLPLAPDEKAPWAPTEGETGANGYLEWLRSLVAPTPARDGD